MVQIKTLKNIRIIDYDYLTYPMVLPGIDYHRVEIIVVARQKIMGHIYELMVGHASLDIRPEDKTAAISWVHVDENYRGKGIGTGIIEKAWEECQDHKMEALLLSADNSPDQDRLIDFYSKLGFVPYETTEEGHIYMRRTE